MNFGNLDSKYWGEQIARVQAAKDKIDRRGDAIIDGRVVPAGDDLVIGAARRLPMAVMFLDICAFSTRDSRTEEQQNLMLKALTLFLGTMIRIAEDYGGTVEKNTGDGLMAYFEDGGGDPPTGGSQRAVAAALTMRAVNSQAVSPTLVGWGMTPFQFRVSIDYGTVSVAKIGVAHKFTSYAAIGNAANCASKMLKHAGANQIVLGAIAVGQLPAVWQLTHCKLLPIHTGWQYVGSGEPYPLYEFDGYWTIPL